jgi:hypothetical protein
LEFRRDLAIYNLKNLAVSIVSSRKRIHHAGVSNTTSLTSESLSPPNIQEKALSMIQEKAKFLKEKVINAAVVVQPFSITIDPKELPTLASKQICLQKDKDITPVLRDILKLAKKIKSSGVDLLKVLHYDDTTTSLVEVPCSA